MTELGPLAYENWRVSQADPSAWRGAAEFPLFSDAYIIGSDIAEDLGPYEIINPINAFDRSGRRPALVLRITFYLDGDELPSMRQTDDSRYHGGWLPDELAALLSLSLGVRLKAGGCVRRFEVGGDARGVPMAHGTPADPRLPDVHGPLVVPALRGSPNLDDLKQAIPLAIFPRLAPAAAIALVKAARMYQEAVWIADTAPTISWIMLTSAVETAALHWGTSAEPPLELLQTTHPDLVALLDTKSDPAFTLRVAEHLAPYMGATRRFRDFLLEFLPAPPAPRPEFGQVPWEPRALGKVFTTVYRYRSRALHSGTPFPDPMCRPPHRSGADGVPAEVPMGLATSVGHATWLAKDTPLLLHTFEYLARQALLRWWRWMADLNT